MFGDPSTATDNTTIGPSAETSDTAALGPRPLGGDRYLHFASALAFLLVRLQERQKPFLSLCFAHPFGGSIPRSKSISVLAFPGPANSPLHLFNFAR
ncbi:hypothetical protein SKAU_G00387820 [Synaphobranchus kaupii]|uniref:Uncharacterized protein n=1 Tax=Synaphobranchus kaupii TaxID=118154 RepID=A0A9Q1EAX4_SYNKA|nr:hypothetical protein SKAU_G00387820 [Synaphobranchus kaupii]